MPNHVKTYRIGVLVELRVVSEIDVEADTLDEARAKVHDMSTDDVIRGIGADFWDVVQPHDHGVLD